MAASTSRSNGTIKAPSGASGASGFASTTTAAQATGGGSVVDRARASAKLVELNLRSLRRHDTSIASIVHSVSYVALYRLEASSDDAAAAAEGSTNKWARTGIEGPLFLFERSDSGNENGEALPSNKQKQKKRKYGFFVLNRHGLDYVSDDLAPTSELELSADLLVLEGAAGVEDERQATIHGVWVAERDQLQSLYDKADELRKLSVVLGAPSTSVATQQQAAAKSISIDDLFKSIQARAGSSNTTAAAAAPAAAAPAPAAAPVVSPTPPMPTHAPSAPAVPPHHHHTATTTSSLPAATSSPGSGGGSGGRSLLESLFASATKQHSSPRQQQQQQQQSAPVRTTQDLLAAMSSPPPPSTVAPAQLPQPAPVQPAKTGARASAGRENDIPVPSAPAPAPASTSTSTTRPSGTKTAAPVGAQTQKAPPSRASSPHKAAPVPSATSPTPAAAATQAAPAPAPLFAPPLLSHDIFDKLPPPPDVSLGGTGTSADAAPSKDKDKAKSKPEPPRPVGSAGPPPPPPTSSRAATASASAPAPAPQVQQPQEAAAQKAKRVAPPASSPQVSPVADGSAPQPPAAAPAQPAKQHKSKQVVNGTGNAAPAPASLDPQVALAVLDETLAQHNKSTGGAAAEEGSELLDKGEFVRQVRELLFTPAFSTKLYASYVRRVSDSL